MRTVNLVLLILVSTAAVARAELIVVDVRPAANTRDAGRYLQLVEGAAMEPFFDTGHSVFDAPAQQAEAFGASVVLVVLLEISEEAGVVVPTAVTYSLSLVGNDDLRYTGRVQAEGDEVSPDEQSVRLGRSAAEAALAEWNGR